MTEFWGVLFAGTGSDDGRIYAISLNGTFPPQPVAELRDGGRRLVDHELSAGAPQHAARSSGDVAGWAQGRVARRLLEQLVVQCKVCTLQ